MCGKTTRTCCTKTMRQKCCARSARTSSCAQRPPKEGKIELIAERDGLFLADTKRLYAVNSLGRMMIATRPSGIPVKAGDKLCGTRVIPLVIEKAAMQQAKEVAGETPILRLAPIKAKRYGVVTTGNEVFYGRIQDTFTPVLEEKLGEFGCEMIAHELSDDDPAHITAAIERMLKAGAELVLCTGGMSVDPRRQDPSGHQKHRRAHRLLRRARAARGDVFAFVFGRRPAGVRPAGLRHVRQAHPFSTWCCPTCWPMSPSRPKCSPGWGTAGYA